MNLARTHHLEIGTVTTYRAPIGNFRALYRDADGNSFRAMGHTRFAAIGELLIKIGAGASVEPECEREDFDRQAAAFDHARDLHKNWEAA